MNAAVEAELAESNPCVLKGVKKPKVRHEAQALTPAELLTYLDAVDDRFAYRWRSRGYARCAAAKCARCGGLVADQAARRGVPTLLSLGNREPRNRKECGVLSFVRVSR